MSDIIIHTDGGARGNPGPAAIGVEIKTESGHVLTRISRTIGVATNNVAEYEAVIAALDWISKHKTNVPELTHGKIRFFLDSQLISRQLKGTYKIKQETLRRLVIRAKSLEAMIKTPISYSEIPREQNKEADLLVNKALDGS